MGTRRLAALAATAILGTGLLGACATGSSDDDSAAPKVDKNAKITGTVSLQTWALKPKFTDYVQGVIDGFEKEHPGVKVKWLDQPGDGYDQKVLTQAASGDLPDVTNLPPDFALPLAKQGMLVDLTKNDDSLEKDYVAGGLSAYQYAGLDGTYGYPWYLGTDVNYWNTKLMSKYGLDPNHLPTDLDSLIAQAKVMKEKSGGKVFLMSRKPGLNDFVNAGIPIFNDAGDKVVFNTPDAAALVQKYADAYQDGLLPKDVLSDKYLGNSSLYSAEKVAWTTGGGNHITSTLANDAPSLVPVTKPSPAFGGIGPMYVQGLSVSSKSKNLPAAIALARWVTNAENQKEFAKIVPGIFPSTTASASDPFFSQSDGTNAGDAKVIAFATAKPNPAQWSSAMDDILKQQLSLAISGQVPPQKALDDAVEQCNKILADS